MASDSMKYDFGICGKCKYSTEELVRDHPNGSDDLEATAVLLALPGTTDHFLIVTPHRTTCPFHTSQRVSARGH